MYKDYLLATFGRADLKGLDMIGLILETYDINKMTYQNIYADIAHLYATTPSAVERCVRNYIKTLVQDKGLTSIASELRYQIKPGQVTLTIKEFLPLIKLRAEQA